MMKSRRNSQSTRRSAVTRPFARRCAAALLLSALGTLAAPALADVRAGVTAWEAGDYARAVTEWRPLAIAGDADAQFNLGQAYKLGRGVAQSLPDAAAWFRRAADQHHLQSEDNLGLVLYEMGQKADALPWLQRSSARGEPRAQYVLAAEYFNGERITRDWPRAYALMKRASDAGLQRAAAGLVQMDQAIPLEQRQQGLAMAQQMEVSEGQARLAAMTATQPTRATPTPTVRPTALPPSQPSTTYAPPPMDGGMVAMGTAGAPPGATMPPVPTYTPGATYAGTPDYTSGPANRSPQVAAPVPAHHTAPPPARVATPAPAPARAAAPAPAAASGAWRIQLGAFSDRGRAQALWSGLAGRLSGAQPVYAAAGNVVRLQAGPYATRASAEHACATIRPQACFAVAR